MWMRDNILFIYHQNFKGEGNLFYHDNFVTSGSSLGFRRDYYTLLLHYTLFLVKATAIVGLDTLVIILPH